MRTTGIMSIMVLLLSIVGSATANWVTSGDDMYAEVLGNVGIGTTIPDEKLTVEGTIHAVASGFEQKAIWGHATSIEGEINYGGYFKADSIKGRGVSGFASGDQGYGVYGEATNLGDVVNYGGYFISQGSDGIGAYGFGSTGLYGEGIKLGALGPIDGTGIEGNGYSIGVMGSAWASFGRGVYGEASNGRDDVKNYGGFFVAAGGEGRGVYGEASDGNDVENYGGYFKADGRSGIGVYGHANYTGDDRRGANTYGGYFVGEGTYRQIMMGGPTGIGIYARGNRLAGDFDGSVRIKGAASITGNLTKGGGSFKIDHPLDPENKYLQHSFVESPDMMNIYNGNVTLNDDGQAVVLLPEYFEALNCDYRYQLTCIGGFAPVYIEEKISDNCFKIAGGKPGMEISWQVTGIRHDPYVVANRIQVEQDKPVEERGYYLHPKAYGFSEEKSIERVRDSWPSKAQEVARKAPSYERNKYYD